MEPLPSHHDMRRAMLRDEIRLIDERTRNPRPRIEADSTGASHLRALSAWAHRVRRHATISDAPEAQPETAV